MASARGAPIWQTRSTCADVDAELERRGRDDDRHLARLELLLGVEADARATGCRGARRPGPRRAARSSACATRSTSRRVLTKTIVVRCSPTSADDAVVDRRPQLVARDRAELEVGRSRSRGRARGGGRCRRCAVGVPSAARRCRPAAAPTSSIGFCVAERPMRCSAPADERVEPLERQRQVRAALVARDGVDLVDDDGRAPAQEAAGCFSAVSRM